ncbi:MAG TPA: polymorphic toxin type 15 domain-containing protein, partial [Kofleriaceae bacterium]
LIDAMAKAADLMNWAGLSRLTFPSFQNKFEAGVIAVSAENFGFTVGGFLQGGGSLALDNARISFDGSAKVTIPGGSEGELRIKQDPTGALTGSLNILVQIGSVAGTVVATLSRGFVSIMGQVGYSGDRLSGKVTLVATDEATARDITLAKPSAGGDVPIELPGPDKPARPGKRAFCGWGQLTFRVTDWLAGAATVIVNSRGQATIIGEIAPPKEFILFDQKEWIKKILKLEIRAGYGIPVVGQVGIFASIGLDAIAKVGPGKLYNIKLSGAYSTDPRVARNLAIEGTLNISAFAGLRLRAEAGLVVTILGHDIKAGVGLNAIAGVRGYVEATPRIGMRELAPGGKREYFLQGHLEIAAQPVLGFSGDLFVAIETPWWSPLSDKRWTWPLFSIEYPLPGEFGIGADVDYVLGSRQWPKIAFGEVNFDASKFMTDVMNDNTDSGSGGEQKKQGEWQEGLGAAGKGGAKNKGGAGKKPGELDEDGPIGEEETFSDGKETHRLWFEQKGVNTTLMMASGRPTGVQGKLAEFDHSIDLLGEDKQNHARSLLGKVKEQLAGLDTEADQLAAMRLAARRAKEVYAKAKDRSRKKGSKGKDGLRELAKKVTADQRKVRDPLSQLAFLILEIPFKPGAATAAMDGGTQALRTVEDGGGAAVNADGKEIRKFLADISPGGPIIKAKNPAGVQAVKLAREQVLPLATDLKKIKIRGGRINRLQADRLVQLFGKVEKVISKLGQKLLRIRNLHRALKIDPIAQKNISFIFYRLPVAQHQQNLEAEVARQLKKQQDGMNRLTVDQFLVNADTYQSDKFEYFDKLRGKAKAAVVAELEERARTAIAGAHGNTEKLSKELTKLQAQLKTVEDQIAAETKAIAEARERTAQAQATRDAAKARRHELEKQRSQVNREFRAATREQGAQGATLASAQLVETQLAALDLEDANATKATMSSDEVRAFTARYENLEAWRKKHKKALGAISADKAFLATWDGMQLKGNDFAYAILHNPDQVVGGKGMLDLDAIKVPPTGSSPEHKAEWDRYVQRVKDQIGAHYVNQRLGGFAGEGETREGWPKHVPDLRKHAKIESRTNAAYGIWRMTVKLDPQYEPPVTKK